MFGSLPVRLPIDLLEVDAVSDHSPLPSEEEHVAEGSPEEVYDPSEAAEY